MSAAQGRRRDPAVEVAVRRPSASARKQPTQLGGKQPIRPGGKQPIRLDRQPTKPARRPTRPARQPKFAGLARSSGLFLLIVAVAALVAAVVGTDLTATGPVVGIASPPWIVRFGIPVLRTLLDLGAVSAAGLGLLSKLVGFDRPERTEKVVARARRLAVWASALWGVAALVSIVMLSVELDPTHAPNPASVWSYITNIAAGKGLLLSAGCALLSFWLARVSVRHGEKVPAELRIGIALFGLLPLPLTGHASNWYYHDLSMVSMELHVVAATAWAGALAAVVVFLAREPALLADALPRFSTLATWCVFVVGFTGIFNGLLELALSPITHLPGSIFTTRYGVLLTAKATCLVIVTVTAVHVRRKIMPRVAAGKRTGIALWCGWEVVTLAAAFGIAVVLTRAPVTPF
ncbi:putative copper resistance protein D [Nakamurella sp. UYEF19]|uniref:copper resistance D family protein n=1 Tax=Nakamurella sp. UYEF19 TaxID=1756392 RepID=UPI003395684C